MENAFKKAIYFSKNFDFVVTNMKRTVLDDWMIIFEI